MTDLTPCVVPDCTKAAIAGILCDEHDQTRRAPVLPLTQPCGTAAAYAQHLRRNQVPDDLCLAAAAKKSARHRAIRAGASWVDEPLEPGTYRGPAACNAAGVTYRQLDYWARTNFAGPSIRKAAGSGTYRVYSRDDIVRIAAIKHLLDLGLSAHATRTCIDPLMQHGYLERTVNGWPAVRLTLDLNAITRQVDEQLATITPEQAESITQLRTAD